MEIEDKFARVRKVLTALGTGPGHWKTNDISNDEIRAALNDLPDPGVVNVGLVDSLKHLLRHRERQVHDLKARLDRANTILSNEVIVKKPHLKRAVLAAIKALSY